MNERGYKSSPEAGGFSASDSAAEKKDKKPGRIVRGIRNVVVAAAAAGVLSSAASAEGAKGQADTSKQEQREASRMNLEDQVLHYMDNALNKGLSRSIVEQNLRQSFALLKEGILQDKSADSVKSQIDSLWPEMYRLPDSKDYPIDPNDTELMGIYKLYDSLMFEMDAIDEKVQKEINMIHPDTLSQNFNFTEEWAQANVGKIFLQGDKLIVVGKGESPDEQTASDKAMFEAQAGMAKYLAQEGAPQYGGEFVSIFGTEEIAHFRETKDDGKHQSVKVMGTSVKKNLRK
ncbi:MAG: hypothetical protein WCV50_01825 [Patescibacteria group bacterium]|jgi:hypothetical protein